MMDEEWNWDDVKRIIVVLKDGRQIELSEEAIKELRGALVLKAIHGM
ncbi:MAG: hypothetical protein N2V76_03275 [Methanophagales archaeon]|nr:hypothetical protein [Methanophagales archaeon]